MGNDLSHGQVYVSGCVNGHHVPDDTRWYGRDEPDSYMLSSSINYVLTDAILLLKLLAQRDVRTKNGYAHSYEIALRFVSGDTLSRNVRQEVMKQWERLMPAWKATNDVFWTHKMVEEHQWYNLFTGTNTEFRIKLFVDAPAP